MSEIDIIDISPQSREVNIALANFGLPYVSDIGLRCAGHGMERGSYHIRRSSRKGHHIIMTLSGSGWTVINHKKEVLTKGSLWFTASGAPQDYGLEGSNWEILWFEFEEDSPWWEKFFKNRSSNLQTHLWGHQLLEILMGLYHEQQQDHYASGKIRELYARQVVLYLERELLTRSTSKKMNDHQRGFNQMLNQLRKDPATDWSIEKLQRASGLHMCPDHFIRISKDISGKTPMQLVGEERMRKTAELLNLSDYKLEQIAILTGYSSPYALSSAFKRHFGMSPRTYRSRNAPPETDCISKSS